MLGDNQEVHSELVALYCCKLCKARMFKRDMERHAQRHGLEPPYRKYFTRGQPEVFPRPGDAHVPLNPKHKRR